MRIGLITCDGRAIGTVDWNVGEAPAVKLASFESSDDTLPSSAPNRAGQVPQHGIGEAPAASGHGGHGESHPSAGHHHADHPAPTHPAPAHGARRHVDPDSHPSSSHSYEPGGSEPHQEEPGEKRRQQPQQMPSYVTSGTLKDQRSRFAKELQENPELRTKLKRVMSNEQGEHQAGTQAIAESAMNRASIRGTSLAEQLHWHDKHSGKGYYAKGSMGRGAVEHPATNARLEQGIENALSGSDLARGATDNSSGGLAAREQAAGKFATRAKINGETFSRPASAEPALASKWQHWHDAVSAPRPPVVTVPRKVREAETIDPATEPM